MNTLKKRILEISHKFKLSHIGSNMITVDTLDKIYSIKKKNEPFILSNGHAGLALYVVLEKYEGQDAEKLFKKHGVHPNRDKKDGIWASTGSLGHGIGIAVGMALSDRERTVYVTMSDGEMMEGSVWEALRIASDFRLENLRVAVIANGYSAYQKVDTEWLDMATQMFYPSLFVKENMYEHPDYLNGLEAHYHVMTDEEYTEVTKP
jgi:transketolase